VTLFDHEKLAVYQASIAFVAWVGEALEGPLSTCRLSAVKHLDDASQSIPNNIAEGNGKRSATDRCRFLDIAIGSALETTCLDVLVARGRLISEFAHHGKAMLNRIVAMLCKLLETTRARAFEDVGREAARYRDSIRFRLPPVAPDLEVSTIRRSQLSHRSGLCGSAYRPRCPATR
jgi:four helix bundle protein